MSTAGIVLAALLGALGGEDPPAGPPSILFILTDDHHHQALGAAGNPRLRTPRLDGLAGRGVRFPWAVAVCPQCVPSRASLLTGLFPHQSGVISNDEGGEALRRRKDQPPTVVQKLRGAGYHTALIGKWHLTISPGEAGFGEVRLWLRKGQESYLDPHLSHGEEGAPARRAGHITDLLTSDALQFLEENRSRRFFLWLAYTAPHRPISEPALYQDLYRGKPAADLVPPAHAPLSGERAFDWGSYYAAVTHLDEAVGRLLESLDRLRLRERTLVAVMGDNGMVGGAFGHVGKVLPLEDSIRVPLMLSLPGRFREGAASLEAVSSLDLPATWLALAGLAPLPGMKGRSLLPLLETGTGNERGVEAAGEAFRGRGVVCEFSGTRAMFGEVDPYRLIRTARHKYVVHRSGRERLHDLARDPHELTDLSAEPEGRVLKEELRARLEASLRETGDREGLAWLEAAGRAPPGGR